MPLSNARTQAAPHMLREVAAGLAASQKELPPKYFYDRRGSELFEEITRLPEYYLTRTERSLLHAWMPELVPALGVRTVVELGAGSGEKTRLILEAMRATGGSGRYVPIDVSAGFLADTAAKLQRVFPGLLVEPVVADMTESLPLPRHVPRPALFVLLGSTIGNFHPAAAIRLLARIRAAMQPDDRLLLGVDLQKDAARIEAAYNDRRGVTAAFNRNVLHVLNHELGANFDPMAFEHRAFYDRDAYRIEMHLVSVRDQRVTIPGIGVVPFQAGESIRTEISCKYDRPTVECLFGAAGLQLAEWRNDAERLFALTLGAPA